MARMDGKPEVQHYVPKMLLRSFGVRGKTKEPQIYAFDKQQKKAFQTSVDNVAAERAFYDLDIGGERPSIEPLLSELESKAKQAIERLASERDLKCLQDEERSWIAVFLAAQHTRTRNFREVIADSDRQFVEQLKARGIEPHMISNYRPLSGEEEVKRFSTSFLIKSLPDFAAQMRHKRWALMEATPGSVFLIGDNPITLHNDMDFGPRGNLGLGVEGIQIHLPLAPDLTLALWRPMLAQSIVDGLRKAERGVRNFDAMLTLGQNVNREAIIDAKRKVTEILERTRPIAQSLELGRPVRCIPENMDFFNSLQVRWAERFVMSNVNDFSMAESYLKDFPHAMKGPRMQVN